MSEVSLDIKQLLQLIYLDVYEGVTPFIQYTRGDQGLEIRSVKIRAGNIPFDAEGKIVVNDDLLKEPLLAADNVWQVEVAFGEDLPDHASGGYNLSVAELFSSGTNAPCTLFHTLPVRILQNAGKTTTQWLKTAGIYEIGQLCVMTDEALRKLVSERPRINLIELRTKARLLESPIPALPAKITTRESLYTLSRLTVKELLSRFPAGTMDARGCRSLLNYLGLLATCVNDRFLRKKGLEWLKRNWG
ncbi:MAG TPA: hypothetical protein P5228_08405 [Bacteroidales bacterium]|nr:hypothetical protein [Bacteroidales bacterium]HRZ48090.1 hypothetical protein [Bacteroidales bacterium]